MTPLSIFLPFLPIIALSTADLDGLTNCGDTSTVPGLIGENTTVSFPIFGTCKTVIANYADGSEESISVEPSDCDPSTIADASQVYRVIFGSSSPRGVASILFNCNGGLQVFCQRYNITTGDTASVQDSTNITAICNETTTYPLLSSGGPAGGVVASTPISAGQTPSTLVTVTPAPSQGPYDTTSMGPATESPVESGQSQGQSAGDSYGEPSRTGATPTTNQDSGTPQTSAGEGGGTVDGGGVNTSPSSTIPSATAAAEQSTRSPINTPNFPYTPLAPQSSCTCTC